MTRTNRNRKASVKPSKKTLITLDIPMIGKGTYSSDKRRSKSITTVTAPVSRGNKRQQRAPNVRSTSHSERITGSGILCDISNAPGQINTQQVFAINPGLHAIFPWVSEMSPLFTKYIIHRLRFSFKTAASTSTPGTITLFGDANVTNPLPSSMTQAVSYEGAVTGPVWNNNSLDLPVLGREFYLRSGAVPPGQDPKTYDCYQFSFLVTGALSPSELPLLLGYIEVEYDMEFIDRKIGLSTLCECISVLHESGVANSVWDALNSPPVMGVPTFSLFVDEVIDEYYVGFPSGMWMLQVTGTSGDHQFSNASTLAFEPMATSDQVTVFPAQDMSHLTTDPGTFGCGIFVSGSPIGDGSINLLYVFSVQNSAGDFTQSNAGWFHVTQNGWTASTTLLTTVTSSYMGAVLAPTISQVGPSPLVISSRIPAHLAHLPARLPSHRVGARGPSARAASSYVPDPKLQPCSGCATCVTVPRECFDHPEEYSSCCKRCVRAVSEWS